MYRQHDTLFYEAIALDELHRDNIINIQRRMGDYHFKKAKTWEDMRVEHDRWVADYNFQVHWAHRHREDNRHSPAEVLGWVQVKLWRPEQLDHVFYSTRFVRRLNRHGYFSP